MSTTLNARIDAAVATARAWRDPEHPERAQAVAATLAADNRFTEEALAFALNQAMHATNPTALTRWVGDREARDPGVVGLWIEDDAPLAGWRDLLAAVFAGHRVRLRPSEASPVLLPALGAALSRALGVDVVEAVASEDFEEGASFAVLIGLGVEEEALDGVAAAARWMRPPQYSVAVIGADETPEVRIGLAEDALLYAGAGSRSVRLVWAPEGISPDPVLDAFSAFSELFPPHPDWNGVLEMPRAFLKAAKQSYAWGDGFLLSKGEPEPQARGHIRWAEYAQLDDVADWLDRQSDVAVVVASAGIGAALGTTHPVVAPGDAHRPRLEEQGGEALYALLTGDVLP